MRTTVICGPAACGKTTNSGHLVALFDAEIVVDCWDPRFHALEAGGIHLTTASPEQVRKHIRPELHSRVVIKSFAECCLPSVPLKAADELFTRPFPKGATRPKDPHLLYRRDDGK